MSTFEFEGFHHWYHEDFANGKVDAGKYFGCSKVFDITPTGTFNLLLKVNTKYCHGVLAFAGNNMMLVEIFYNPTVSSNGTAVMINNFKTYSPNTASTQLFYTPTS